MDRVCLAPYSVAIAALGAVASWAPARAADPGIRWYASSPAMRWCLALYCAKTTLDIVTQLATWRHADAKRSEILAHHVVSVGAIGYGLLASKQCLFYGALAVVTEASTFFLNNVMATKFFTGERTSAQRGFVALNGVLLWLSYLVCRLALLPFWPYRFFKDVASTENLFSHVSALQLVLYPLSVLAILLLSCFWFLLITKGLLKALTGAGKKKPAVDPPPLSKSDDTNGEKSPKNDGYPNVRTQHTHADASSRQVLQRRPVVPRANLRSHTTRSVSPPADKKKAR